MITRNGPKDMSTFRTQFRPVEGDDAVCLPRNSFVHHGRSGPVGRGSVMVRRMRVFALAGEMGRGGGNCFGQFVSDLVAWFAFMTWNPYEVDGASIICPVAGK